MAVDVIVLVWFAVAVAVVASAVGRAGRLRPNPATPQQTRRSDTGRRRAYSASTMLEPADSLTVAAQVVIERGPRAGVHRSDTNANMRI